MQTKANLLSQLVTKLVQQGVIKSPEVIEAMMAVDRGEFCEYDAYRDVPQQIGYEATISAPHMHGYALELLRDHLVTAERVLDVGSGSGYLTAAMFKMLQSPTAIVVGIEHIPELITKSISNLNKSSKKELDKGQIIIVQGDGRQGYQDTAPYDCIHVGAAAPKIPTALLDQLKKGGRMIIPVGITDQKLLVVDKDQNGKVTSQDILSVRYVPLKEFTQS